MPPAVPPQGVEWKVGKREAAGSKKLVEEIPLKSYTGLIQDFTPSRSWSGVGSAWPPGAITATPGTLVLCWVTKPWESAPCGVLCCCSDTRCYCFALSVHQCLLPVSLLQWSFKQAHDCLVVFFFYQQTGNFSFFFFFLQAVSNTTWEGGSEVTLGVVPLASPLPMLFLSSLFPTWSKVGGA